MIDGQSVPMCPLLPEACPSIECDNPPESMLYAATRLSANTSLPGGIHSWVAHSESPIPEITCPKMLLKWSSSLMITIGGQEIFEASCHCRKSWLRAQKENYMFVHVYYVFVFFTVVYTDLRRRLQLLVLLLPCASASCCRCLLLHNDVWPRLLQNDPGRTKQHCKSQPAFFTTTLVMMFCIVLEF